MKKSKAQTLCHKVKIAKLKAKIGHHNETCLKKFELHWIKMKFKFKVIYFVKEKINLKDFSIESIKKNVKKPQLDYKINLII